MGPIEALELALSKEEEAIRIYGKFILEHSAVKDIFQFLMGEEEKHKKLIETRIAELRSK